MATFRRRGIIGELEEKMVGRMVERGYEEEFARRCFDQIKGFGEYGFPESHAASFAHLVYVSAWLKCHFPAVFAAALLNSQPMGFYASAQIVRDAREHGVEVRGPDVNVSDWDSTLEAGEGNSPALRLGLREVKGLEADGRAIVAGGTAMPGIDVLGLDPRTHGAGGGIPACPWMLGSSPSKRRGGKGGDLHLACRPAASGRHAAGGDRDAGGGGCLRLARPRPPPGAVAGESPRQDPRSAAVRPCARASRARGAGRASRNAAVGRGRERLPDHQAVAQGPPHGVPARRFAGRTGSPTLRR
jgi:hypothetical protein